MSKLNRREMMAAGAGLLPLAGLAAVASGQEPFSPAPRTPRGNGEQIGTGTGVQSNTARNADGAMLDNQDPGLAACLLIKGHKQIQVCTFALEKIEHPDVKAFAQAEIDEHETLKKKLQDLGYQFPAAPASRGDVGGGVNTDGNRRPAGRTLAVGKNMLPQAIADMVAINVEVGEQCIATCKAEQSKLSGLKFDKAFVGSQLHAHYDLFDHGVVFRKHASREMAPVLDMAKPIIEQHIATCKRLMEKLEAAKA